MSTTCTICTHPRRLEIDQQLVKGGAVAKLAKIYSLGYSSLYRHSKNCLSRQISQAYFKKDLEHSFDLMRTIDEILSKTEIIFDRNFQAKKDSVALKALESKRQTIQLLANISYALHQSKLTELEILKQKSGEVDAEQQERYMKGLEVLSIYELKVFKRLIHKITHRTDEIIVLPNTSHSDFGEESAFSSASTHSYIESRPEPPKIADEIVNENTTINDLKVVPIKLEQIPTSRRRRRRKVANEQ